MSRLIPNLKHGFTHTNMPGQNVATNQWQFSNMGGTVEYPGQFVPQNMPDATMSDLNINYGQQPMEQPLGHAPGQFDYGTGPGGVQHLDSSKQILTELPPGYFPFSNNGYDLPNGDFVICKDDLIMSPENTKYKIVELIGKGTFGQVVKCRNMNNGEEVAIKVLKNKRAYRNQGSVEIKILHMLKTMDQMGDHHIVEMQDYFMYRDHLCIVFELLSFSLYDLIAKNNFTGLSLNLSRLLISQILESLLMTKQAGLIHCDLKPENILLCSPKSGSLKVIDYGSACFQGYTVYTYIQSRYYRSPEVIMGMQYTPAIDMWSLGCI